MDTDSEDGSLREFKSCQFVKFASEISFIRVHPCPSVVENVFPDSKMAFLRALLAHGFRIALRARGDARRGAGKSRLARLAGFWVDSRCDGLRAYLRDGVQSDCGSQI